MVRQLDAAVCHGIIAQRRHDLKQRQIAMQYITQGVLSKILMRNAITGVPTPRPRPGRPLKTKRRQDFLIRMCTRRTQTTNALRREWQNATILCAIRTLVNGPLIRAWYRARRPVRKPLLHQRHRQRRLQWAREHARLTPQHWTHVVFSDEARFEVYRHDGRIRVRRRVEEAYL